MADRHRAGLFPGRWRGTGVLSRAPRRNVAANDTGLDTDVSLTLTTYPSVSAGAARPASRCFTLFPAASLRASAQRYPESLVTLKAESDPGTPPFCSPIRIKKLPPASRAPTSPRVHWIRTFKTTHCSGRPLFHDEFLYAKSQLCSDGPDLHANVFALQ